MDKYKIKKDPIEFARSQGVKIGEGCRLLCLTAGTFGSEPYLVKLGNHVSVTAGVQFVTHDGGVWIFRQEHPDIDVFKPITIGNNVFIGINSIIMPGVTIGDNCVIGAGSVVSKDIPSGSVAAGVPAKTLRTAEEYKQKILDNALHVRSLSHAEKRSFLEKHFFGEIE